MNETNELIEVTVKFFAEDFADKLVTCDTIWKPLEEAGFPPHSIKIHDDGGES